MANFNGLMAKGVPPQSAIILPLKIAIMVLSVVILGLSAYNLSLFNGYVIIASTGPAGFAVFDSIMTLVVVGASVFLELKAPQHYFRIIFLILYCLGLIFWLSAWSWSASVARVFLQTVCTEILGTKACITPDGEAKTYGATLAAVAGLGALVWVLLGAVTVLFVLACIRDDGTGTHASTLEAGRKEGAGAQPYVSTTDTTGQYQYGPPQGGAPYPSN